MYGHRQLTKIAWIPMTSVKKAEPKTTTIVRVIMSAVGCPVSILPVIFANQRYARRTGMVRKITNPIAVSRTQSAVIPLPELTSATVKASNIHPTTKNKSLSIW